MRNDIVFNNGKLNFALLSFLSRYREAAWFSSKFPKLLVSFDSLVGDLALVDRVLCSEKRFSKLVRWSPPPFGFVKVNVDGVMDSLWSKGGIGGLIRDEKGVILGSFSERIGFGPPIMAELMAVKRGLNLFLESGMSANRRLILEFDNAVAMDWIKNPASSTPMFLSIVKDIAAIVVDKGVIVRHVVDNTNWLHSKLSKMNNYGWGDLGAPREANTDGMLHDDFFGIDPFYIEKVLLEGSPGVGKTSLIVALGKFSGHQVVRINLSEQTDMMDLLGSDLPIESDEGMKFAWSDGILLQALKEGCWVLLDELNLAPQSVLEGLNAILDHRAEVFIPELSRTFRCPASFRVFACQNPSSQGGGRKGLPKSFLNRFTKVYIDELVEEDYHFICSSLYPSVPSSVLSNLISFNGRLHEDTMLYHKFGQNGSPWEFNLRDVLRSCQILQGEPVSSFVNLIYVQRMRTAADRRQVMKLYEQIFGVKPSINPYPRVQLNPDYLIVGSAAIKRKFSQPSGSFSQLKVLPSVRCNLEAAAHCVQRGWLCILIGPPSSGKTSLIRLLAQLSGNVLHELNLSSATDISELLGCFEQYNALRDFRLVVSQVGHFVNEYSSLVLEASMDTFLRERKDLIAGWLALLSDVNTGLMPSSSFMCSENWNVISKSLSSLVEIIEQLKFDLEKNVLPVSWSSKDLERTMKTIIKLQDHKKKPYSVKFEWVMGLLIKAIENGEWIVLENANLCNPTVLDRINSLVEPDGTITVNECGFVDGKPVVLHPHSNFRMFLTVNPSFGEVSRAMRNRGVEIFMMDPYWIFEEGSGYNSEELAMEDVKSYLVLAGIPGVKLVDSMAKAHTYARVEGISLNVRITYLELARMANAIDIEDLAWYSREACVKLNCSYLEFLGAHYASHKLAVSCGICPVEDVLHRCGCKGTYLLDLKLHRRLHPHVSKRVTSDSDDKMELNLNVTNKMMLFAANWAIEQATEDDFQLYLQWFSWFSFQLESYDTSSKLLSDAIRCVGLLRLSSQQWNAERIVDLLSVIVKRCWKAEKICPSAVENMLVTKNFAENLSLCFKSEKSLLWVHGGHPILPSSPKLYHQQHQLLQFCDFVWPTKGKSFKQGMLPMLVSLWKFLFLFYRNLGL
ncbi:hypothetical protein F3Y22_tig00111769pilonHSYRG00499 [Hibiscus syriacus]|uniref:AAA+ ATPase domain-containing protein n=1 Tax=Hibiscus syriacus TaxID=106335 RepID=A0A6A2XVZ6_HIBSY|nr:hypothetical protein F3Y22_tig00111769pilonHSYRG00499 [Hibiscus syriacus]